METSQPHTFAVVPPEAHGHARILVCGGRDFTDHAYLWHVLDRIHGIVGIACIIHGAATGADTLAHEWAAKNGVLVEQYPANWSTFGKAAGALRNARMLRESNPHQVIAFPGGRGTADMVHRAERAHVRVLDLRNYGAVAA